MAYYLYILNHSAQTKHLYYTHVPRPFFRQWRFFVLRNHEFVENKRKRYIIEIIVNLLFEDMTFLSTSDLSSFNEDLDVSFIYLY